MNDADRSRPDPELAPLLAALPQSIAPPDALEARVLSAIRVSRWMPRAVAVAAALVLFLSGAATGRFLTTTSVSDSGASRYVLLLYEDANYRDAGTDGAAARVDEYRAWARDLSRRGVGVTGERLEQHGIELNAPDSTSAGGAPTEAVGGFFIITASSREDAERIAKTCPHLRYGGRVIVKAILPT